MVKPLVLDQIRAILIPGDFYLDANASIYRTLLTLHIEGVAIDTLTLADALKQQGDLADIGGAAYLADILQSCPTAANAKHYANIVRDDSRKRQIRRLATRMLVESANGRPTDDLAASIRTEIDDIECAEPGWRDCKARRTETRTSILDYRPFPVTSFPNRVGDL